jgi:monoamine oxidase
MGMSLPSDIDVAIIGAGAAGIAAARTLEGTGLSVLILEARDRLGGRGHTVIMPNDIPFDLGCGWLHSADENNFVPIAESLGFEIDKTRPPWREQVYDKGFPAAERADFSVALDAFYDRAEIAAQTGRDSAADQYLEAGNRWNPMIDAISTYVNGVELDQVSILDMDAYEDTEVNWRVRCGYGALIAAYGTPCRVSLNTQVTLIDHSGALIKIETSRGTITAGKVIVTVPTNLLANESISFHPALPEKVDAAANLPLGLADKTMLSLDGPQDSKNVLPKDGSLRAATMRTAMGTYHLRPFGQNCIEGFFGGKFARDLEDAGDGALMATSIDEIVALLGSDYRKKLKPLGESRWAHDVFAHGSYSHALPGHADKRAVLAAPVDGRLFFAGEATSPHFFSTAHGAQETGVRAAGEVMGKPHSS